MGKVNAHGGCIVKELDANGPQTRIEVAEVELDLEEMIDDTTDSGSGGSAEGLPCLVKVQSISMSVSEDSANYPEALGLRIGSVVNLFLRRGSLNQWDYIYGTIVKSLRKVNDNNGKARKISVTTEYGVYTHNVAPPPGF